MKPLLKTKDYKGISRFNSYELATIMDYINEFVIKYYVRDIDIEPSPYTISDYIYRVNNKLNSSKFELAMNIMEDLQYVRTTTFEDEPSTVKSLHHTEKGLQAFFNGGFRQEYRRKKKMDLLIAVGQISILIAGIYYLLEIIKILFPCILE